MAGNLGGRVQREEGRGGPCRRRAGVEPGRNVRPDISEREAIVAILTHLGIPTEPPPIARAREPWFDAA
jgi:hypothetical protein